ncbi:MAG: hypothetical protein HY556_03335 [Euryarchaeota archaeon]|nr:hypothetical protein [Euryarchaeota archaeon]
MRRLVGLAVAACVLIALGGCIEPERGHAIVEDRSIDDATAQKVRHVAIEHLATKPNLTYYRDMTWDEFFDQSDAARQHGTIDELWLRAHNSTIKRNGTGEYLATWVGVPGCEEDASRPWTNDEGPNYFDANGQQCYLLNLLEVHILVDDLSPLWVHATDVGGVA